MIDRYFSCSLKLQYGIFARMSQAFKSHSQEEKVLGKYLGNILIKTVLLTIYYMIKFF